MQNEARPKVVLAAIVGLPVVVFAVLAVSLWLYTRVSEPNAVVVAPARAPAPRAPASLTLIEQARALVREGAASGPYRYGMSMRSVDAGRECTRRMTILFAKHKALMDAARTDETEDRSRVVGAYNDLFLCAGCSQQGDEACARAGVALR
jgi:hypothetical protein